MHCSPTYPVPPVTNMVVAIAEFFILSLYFLAKLYQIAAACFVLKFNLSLF
jgi:hypothetical protein